MPDEGRVITAKLPDGLVDRLDEAAGRLDRSKSWIVRQALMEWLAEEERRYQLTFEALVDADQGETIPHSDLMGMVERRKIERRRGRAESKAPD